LRGATRTELSYPLYEFLTSLQPLQAFVLVIIDEAQNLSTQLLEEVRILSDLENRQRLLQVLLVGQPELQWRLATREMRQLAQRVSMRCEIAPLAAADIGPYVRHRLTVAGGTGTGPFTEAAIDRIFAASNGTPRVVNLVCDRAMFRAFTARATAVDTVHVLAAVDDLELPGARSLRALEAGARGADSPDLLDSNASALNAGEPFRDATQSLPSERDAPQGGGFWSANDGRFPEVPASVAWQEEVAAALRRRRKARALAGVFVAAALAIAMATYASCSHQFVALRVPSTVGTAITTF
jgi:hypothetical protein